MYRFYDEKDKIREIQKYLLMTESGNYDDKTRDAVKEVQKTNGLTESGEIDYETFMTIYREYQKTGDETRILGKFPDTSFPLILGSYGEAVLKTNKMLIGLSERYGIQTNLRNTNYYGERSERILEEISTIYGHSREAGEVDLELYILLEKDFNDIRRGND